MLANQTSLLENFLIYCLPVNVGTMRELTSLEKKEELKIAKRLKSKTHFTLKDILRLMEHYRDNCENLDAMEKMEFIYLMNNSFKFDDKVLLERIFQVFNVEKV